MARKNAQERSRALNFQITESYKKARTNIVYSIIKKGCKKIAFTSPYKGEGKTTTTTNIAIALSQQENTKVIIIDCDLRRPSTHTLLKVSPDMGLVNYLNDECSLEQAISFTENPRLDFISFGAIPPNPSELLASKAMEDMVKLLETKYDYILFDTPPVNMVVDVIPLVKFCDGVAVVVRHNHSTYPDLNRALETLSNNGAKILGIIANRVPPLENHKSGYYLSKHKYDSYKSNSYAHKHGSRIKNKKD